MKDANLQFTNGKEVKTLQMLEDISAASWGQLQMTERMVLVGKSFEVARVELKDTDTGKVEVWSVYHD